jgi:hypothetical protein
MSQLLSTQFNLTLGNLIVARVRASNIKGFGPYSATNTVGALV